MFECAKDCYLQMLEFALPFAIVFNVGNMIVNTLLSVMFGGKLCIKG